MIDFRILLPFKFSIAFVRTRGFVNKILRLQTKRAQIGLQLTPFWLAKDALLKSKQRPFEGLLSTFYILFSQVFDSLWITKAVKKSVFYLFRKMLNAFMSIFFATHNYLSLRRSVAGYVKLQRQARCR